MKDFDRITKYLDKTLDEAEQRAFEEELKTNSELKSEFYLVKLAQQGIVSAGIRDSVAEVQQSYLANRKTMPKGRTVKFVPAVLKYAAIIVGLCLLWTGYELVRLNPKNLLQDYSVSYIEPIMRSTQPEEKKITSLFHDKAYHEILQHIETIDNPSLEQLFLSSMAAYELSKYKQASQFLSAAKALDIHKEYQYEIMYYNGLIAIGQEDYNTAYSIFTEIKKDFQNPYQALATQVFMLKLNYLKSWK